MITEQDIQFMSLALEESKKALPGCLPNPPVGCVLVKGGKLVAKGFTQAPGYHHAEASALETYSESLETDFQSMAAYVTLEPCSFAGRTPSCAKALIDRRISQVFVAILDPDPRNSGKGIKMLTDAGIAVTTGVEADSVQKFIYPYLNKG
ncbi:bifunctional diaminohydroxyphosphoribosylaminopyrimidine deaminase/5-amino-6-(5-phosphoribosylamino)uracil reductase RibD [Shewanella sp. YLB-07]|uniref:bifunctional diaminohydroxyphosphoribosylaminopyrimidine deaminase/5-amino-6-(5-phosphoribosylamino)uracil reductase RibD n=1 Tax=Shewanella sp. YLB-07 TaxID=2601268 RepID=UPI00128E70D2|nr:bifunctional diaminohydroxyphosphoribosylaminopyrimidine deaminase/5-amino-6-(5-phosphoribosylamino)uracil reductase RibD [Shewanella sp. YLB-07]MPY23131.1 riboflavin-specific deaminase [Shewanella sp. YLB-07]